MEVPGRTQTVVKETMSPPTFCTPCLGVNEEEIACFYCIECNEHLCELCGRAHRRAKISKNHELLGEDDMPRNQLPSFEENLCQKHNGKLLEYYCKTHDCFCCSVCLSLDHKECCLQYIEDLALDIQESDEYINVSKEMVEVIGRLEEATVGQRKKILSKHKEFVADIEKFQEEIINTIDKLAKASLAEAASLRDFYLEQEDETMSQCKTTFADIQTFSQRMSDQAKYKQNRQLVISTSKASIKLYEARAKLRCQSKKSSITNYKFEPNRKNLLHLFRGLKNIGKFKKVGRREVQITGSEEVDQSFCELDEYELANQEPEVGSSDDYFNTEVDYKHTDDDQSWNSTDWDARYENSESHESPSSDFDRESFHGYTCSYNYRDNQYRKSSERLNKLKYKKKNRVR